MPANNPDGMAWELLATVDSNVTTYADTGLVPETTYFYRVRALNSAGPSNYTNIADATTLPGPPPSDITLMAKGFTLGGKQVVDLEWTGAAGTTVDIYRNGDLIDTTANDGTYRDTIGRGITGSYTYLVCEIGTSTCSNTASVDF